MTGLSSRCPDPEAIAAFVMGNLSGEELKMTADHLRECEDCREVAAEAARIDREGVPLAPVIPRQQEPARTAPWWLAVAAAALTGLVFLTLWSLISARTDDFLQVLVEAAPREGRYLEPRLTGGFPWAPLQTVRRSSDEPLDPAHMKLVGAAGSVLEKTGNAASVEARHAAAVAHLLAGRPNAASDLLTKAAPAAASAKVWSDLAATRYAASLKTDDPTQLAEALAAADAALRLDSRLPEALFNRALILERLGLRDQARTAWEQYLAVDGGSEWATEARQHLRNLTPVTKFRDELQREYDALSRDAARAHALARQFPQEARVWGETEILARWAEAFRRGDLAAAESHLRVARGFADELTRRGDAMLSRIVAAAENADAAQRNALAQAHVDFRAAQRLYQSDAPAAAEPMFEAAGKAFESGGSPAALLARYFAANTAYDQGRLTEARERLEQLSVSAPAEFPAHRAQLEWQLGLAYASAGRWGDAIRTLTRSATAFEGLRETRYASAVRDILAEVYDRIGDRRAAWGHRIVALRELGRSDPSRLRIALDAAARTAAVNRDWDVSVSLLGLQIDILQRGGNDLLYVEALLERARLHTRLREMKAAAADLLRATQAIERLRDPTVRERAEANRLAVAAFLAPRPADALPLLTRAIEFHRVRGRRMHVPDLLLQRGRAYAATGDTVAAAKDFDTAIDEVDAQRTSVAAEERRWGTFAVAEELFDEAIALALARGDATGAFTYAERARWREEQPSTATAQPAAAAVDGAVLIEYAALPEQLAIFVVSGPKIRAVVDSLGRDELAAEVEALTSPAMSGDTEQFRRASAALYQRLIAPVAQEVGSARTLVFVPDATLSRVPFSALIDGDGRYLIEQRAVVVTPSGAAYARLASQDWSGTNPPQLLLVTGPASRDGDLGIIASIQREADAVAAVYGVAPGETPQEATAETFATRAARADVIHFVGHAVMPDGNDEAALITSREAGAAGRLEATEIAAMRFTRTRAVVLAACGTARSRERPGQTSMSVARAFLAAGVPSVIATLWPIDDAPAAEFFPRFHRHLIRGHSPAEALRAAQLESIRRRDAPPGLWAAVQIIGS